MADTGAPWNLPYPLPTDLVRDGAQAIQDLAEATADGLDAAGGLVAVKHAVKTDTETISQSAGAFDAVTGLSLSHAVSDSSHDVILFAVLSGKHSAGNNASYAGLAVFAGGTIVEAPDSPGNRLASMSISGSPAQTDGGGAVNMTVIARHTPGVTTPVTYDVRVGNGRNNPQTFFINRTSGDSDDANHSRGVSTFILMEVKV